MNQQHLNYEFYFLFLVEYDDNANEHLREPSSFSTSDNLFTIPIDEDKRLFRYDPPDTTGKPLLDDWQQHLQHGWKQIQACYQTDFKPEQAFIGVALLILDESTENHSISCNTTNGKVIFEPSTKKTSMEKILLKVTDGLMDKLKTPVTLEEFVPEYQPDTNQHNWQIQLSVNQPVQLLPMQLGESYAENHPNPIFAVYGLQHGNLPAEAVDQLQTFLCSREVALLARVLPRLIMQKWQFKRLDMTAYQIRKQLDFTNKSYQPIPDIKLKYAKDKELESDLSEMTQIDAKAKQVLARVDAGGKTLEINRYNLERHLQRSRQVWQELDKTPANKKYEWFLEWQNDTETPLLDNFDSNIRGLQNHVTYIQDALAYLDGIRTRWQLHQDGRRLQYESNIQNILLVLTFISSVAALVYLHSTIKFFN